MLKHRLRNTPVRPSPLLQGKNKQKILIWVRKYNRMFKKQCLSVVFNQSDVNNTTNQSEIKDEVMYLQCTMIGPLCSPGSTLWTCCCRYTRLSARVSPVSFQPWYWKWYSTRLSSLCEWKEKLFALAHLYKKEGALVRFKKGLCVTRDSRKIPRDAWK